MSEPCMTDIFEECFRDCPNCPRAVRTDEDIDWDRFDEEDDDDSL